MTSREHYIRILEAAVSRVAPFVPTVEDDKSIQVERGIILPYRLAGNLDVSPVDRLLQADFGSTDVSPVAGGAGHGRDARATDSSSMGIDLAVIDAGGHRRSVYRPLLIYCWLLAYEISPVPVWRSAIRPWALRFAVSATDIDLNDCSGSSGDGIGAAVWGALATYIVGDIFEADSWKRAGALGMAWICENQLDSGAFLKATASDNPETLWYHELILLHAVASYAARTGDITAAQAAERSAHFHLNETQPDHATAQPWGLPAFVRYTPMLADQLLHTVTTQQPAGMDGVSQMLLADTLYGLRKSSQ